MSVFIEGILKDLSCNETIIYNNFPLGGKFSVIVADVDNLSVVSDVPIVKRGKFVKRFAPYADSNEVGLRTYLNLGEKLTTQFLYGYRSEGYTESDDENSIIQLYKNRPVGKILKTIKDARLGRVEYGNRSIRNDSNELSSSVPYASIIIDNRDISEKKIPVELCVSKLGGDVENCDVPPFEIKVTGKFDFKQINKFGDSLRRSIIVGDEKDEELALAAHEDHVARTVSVKF